jgi:hypothetical protein
MSSYGSYCPIGQPFKVSKANGLRFVYTTDLGDFYYGENPDDNILYNEDPFCGMQTEEFQQPFPCDGIIRLQIVWCDDSTPYLGFYDIDDSLISEVAGTNIKDNIYEWDLNLNNDPDFCEQCVVLKIFKKNIGTQMVGDWDFSASSGGSWVDVATSTIVYGSGAGGFDLRTSFHPLGIGQNISLIPGNSYLFSMDIKTISGGTNNILFYNSDSSYGNQSLIKSFPIISNITISVEFIATNTNILLALGSNLRTMIDNVSITSITRVTEAKSEPIKISAYHHCLTKFEYWNDDSYDNVDYSAGYRNILYVGATFEMAKYPEESKVYLKSNGVTKKLSGRLKKLIPMKTDFIPAYMHEKMAIIFSHDNVEINGVAYVKEGEYQINSIDKYTLAQGSTDLTKVIYNYLNSNCD